MKERKILISATPFAEFSQYPIKQLTSHGYESVISPYGSYATENQSITLLTDVIGIIAGLEPLTRKVLESSPSLKIISRVGIGLDNIDLKASEELGIKVLNTPDAPTDAVAELTLGHILTLLRQTVKGDTEIKNGQWIQYPGRLLKGKRVAIIGLGRIGKRLVELLKPFKVQILGFDIVPPWPFIKENEITHFETIKEILPEADVVSLHIPYTKGSEYLMGEKEIALMKKEAVLINCSRGHLIDEAALFNALQEKRITGAALDCFKQEPYRGPLTQTSNIILTPHIGSYAKETRIQMETEATEAMIKHLKDERPGV